MATSFSGLGLGQLGSESRFMTGDNAFSQGLKAAKDFAILYGLDKSGLVGYLNDIGQAKKDMMAKYTGLSPDKTAAVPTNAVPPDAPVSAVPPEQPSAIPSAVVSPNTVPSRDLAPATVPATTPELNLDDLKRSADHSMGITSFVSPDALKPRDPAQDQVATEMASAPPPMQLPQYGNQGGGGINPISVISSLASLFA